MSQELGDNGEFTGSIDSELISHSIELVVTKSVGCEVASILVTYTVVTMVWVVTALDALALVCSRLIDTTRVKSIGLRLTVGFPDVHLLAA
jgi:hypothetical protein